MPSDDPGGGASGAGAGAGYIAAAAVLGTLLLVVIAVVAWLFFDHLPARVTGIQFSAPTQTAFTVSWTAVPGASVYEVEVSSAGSLSTQSVAGTSLEVTGLLPNTQYFVRVAAQNGSTTGFYSAHESSAESCTLPAPVTAASFGAAAFSAATGTCTQAVTWTGTLTSAYRVQWSTSLSGPWTLETVTHATTCVLGTTTALPPDLVYVQINTQNVRGGVTTSQNFVAPPPPPVSQEQIALVSATSATLTLSWPVPSSSLLQTFQVLYGTVSPATTFVGPITVTNGTASCVLGTGTEGFLQGGTAYVVLILALGAGGAVIPGQSFSASTLATSWRTATDFSAFKTYAQLGGGAALPSGCVPAGTGNTAMGVTGGYYSASPNYAGAVESSNVTGWTSSGPNYSIANPSGGFLDNTVQSVYFRTDDPTPATTTFELNSVCIDGSAFNTQALAAAAGITAPAAWVALTGVTSSQTLALGTLTAGTVYTLSMWVSARNAAGTIPVDGNDLQLFLTTSAQGLPSLGATNRLTAVPTFVLSAGAGTSTRGKAYLGFDPVNVVAPWTRVAFQFVAASAAATYLQVGPVTGAYAGTTWEYGYVQISTN